MKFDRNKLGTKWRDYAVAGVVIVAAYLILSHLDLFGRGIAKFCGFIMPVIIGIVIAYVMDPLVKIFEKKVFYRVERPRLRRNISIVCTALVVLIFLAVLIVALIPQVVDSVVTFLENIDSYVSKLQQLLSSLGEKAQSSGVAFDLSGLMQSGSDFIGKLTDIFPDDPTSLLNTSVNIGKSMLNLVIEFILAIYFLIDKKQLAAGLKRFLRALLPETAYRRGGKFWGRCNYILIRYIGCDLLDGLIVGVSNFVFMLITRMPYGVLISVVVGVTNLAPTFGPIAGGVIGFFVLFMVRPWYALWFLIFTIILQTIDGYVIKPNLFGDTLGISSVWVLVSIIVFGRMFGVVGLLIAIPAAAIIDYIYHGAFLPWLEKRRKAAKKTGQMDPQTRMEIKENIEQDILENEIEKDILEDEVRNEMNGEAQKQSPKAQERSGTEEEG